MNGMNNKTLLIIIGVLLVSNLALLGLYLFQPADQKQPSRSDRSPVDYMVRELKLNQQQTSQFQRLFETTKETNKPVYDSLRNGRERLYSLMKLEPQPETLITQYTATLAGFEQQLARNNYEHFRRLRVILDKEQQVKLDTLINKMGKRIGGRRKSG